MIFINKIQTPILTGFASLKIKTSDIDYFPGITDSDDALEQTLRLVYSWAGVIAVLVLVIASMFFVMSRGNPDQMKRSKDAIRASVIGLAIIMVAFTLTQILLGGVQ